MNETNFLRSVPGRLATATGGLSIFGMGVLALGGPGPHVLYVVAAIPLASILISIFTVGLAILEDESNANSIVAILISFPFLAGLSLAGLYSAPMAGTVVGVVLACVGLMIIGASARGVFERMGAPAPAASHGVA